MTKELRILRERNRNQAETIARLMKGNWQENARLSKEQAKLDAMSANIAKRYFQWNFWRRLKYAFTGK